MKNIYITIGLVGVVVWSGFYMYSNSPKAKAKEALNNYLTNDLISMNFTADVIKESKFTEEKDCVRGEIKLDSSYSKRYELYLTYRSDDSEWHNVKLNKIDKLNYECDLQLDNNKDYEYRVDIIGPNHVYSKPEKIVY